MVVPLVRGPFFAFLLLAGALGCADDAVSTGGGGAGQGGTASGAGGSTGLTK